MVVIIALPAATPSEFRNSAQVALVDFNDGNINSQVVQYFDFNLGKFFSDRLGQWLCVHLELHESSMDHLLVWSSYSLWFVNWML